MNAGDPSIMGWPNTIAGNASIGATSGGIAFASLPCVGVILCVPTGQAGPVTVTKGDATVSTGGIEVAVGGTSGMLPTGGNLSNLKGWVGSGTVTLNAMAFK